MIHRCELEGEGDCRDDGGIAVDGLLNTFEMSQGSAQEVVTSSRNPVKRSQR